MHNLLDFIEQFYGGKLALNFIIENQQIYPFTDRRNNEK